MLNEELVRKIAHGEQEALERVNNLPVSVKMAYGLAVDEMRRKESIVPMLNGMEVYVQPNRQESEEDGVSGAFARILEEKKVREAEAEKVRKAHVEKVAKQAAERSRALGSYQ
jgi:hypothetical protein